MIALSVERNGRYADCCAGRAECSSTRYVSDTSEWSQVSRRGIVKNFVAQYCNLILYAFRDPQPVKADECVCDVVGDQLCRCIQNRLESTHSVGRNTHQHAVAVVQPGMHQGNYQLLECGGRYRCSK